MTTRPHLTSGSELLGYRIERVLGRGGMGVVYLAHQLALDRMVALKLLAPEFAADERFRERFLRESKLAASLDHPNIVPVFDAGNADGRLYIAMRFVDGTDLRHLLDEQSPLAPERALAMLGPVADALDTAHARGLVHRDVKPSNILVDQSGRPYLADFGLSKTTSEGGQVEPSHFAASLDYVAPEQIEQQPIGPAADVYALACVLYECLTGQPPFRRDTPLATLFAHLDEPPPKTGGPLDPILAKALAKEPEARYSTCRGLSADAAEALGVRDVVVVRDRRPLLFAVIGATLAIAAALSLLVLNRGDGAPAKASIEPTPAPSVDSLQRIDPKTNMLVATFPLGSDPTGVAVGERAVWVIHLEDNRITKLDPRTDEILATGSAPGPRAVGVGAGSVWVLTSESTVTQLDEDSDERVHEVGVPGAMELLSLGLGSVWVASPSSGVVARINPESSSVAAEVDVAASQGVVKGIAAGEGAVWVASSQTRAEEFGVVRIDPSGRDVVATVPLSVAAEGVGAGAGGVWVANPSGNTVSQIHPATNRVRRAIRVGKGPVAVAVGARAVWVTNYKDGTVSRIDPVSGRVVATIRVGPNPDHVAAGEDGVWVTVHVR